MSTIDDGRTMEYRGVRFRTVGKGIKHCQTCLRTTYNYVGHAEWHATGVGDVGFPVASPLEPGPVALDVLQVAADSLDRPESRQVTGYSDTPRGRQNIPTTPALARATGAVSAPIPDINRMSHVEIRQWLAHAAVSAALHDRVAIRAALRTADDDYQAREHEANVGRGPEPGDWWLFMVNAIADHLLGQDDASTAALLGTHDRAGGAS